MTGPDRREQISAGIAARTGISEAMIERLVHAFYAKVRADEMLAPVFEARIHDWEPHLAQMCAFWSSVALMTGRYHARRWPSTRRCLSMPIISTAGSPCSRRRRVRSARRKRRRILSHLRAGSPRASNWASPGPTASCSASARGSGASRKARERVNENRPPRKPLLPATAD